jgi:hypothetical protein
MLLEEVGCSTPHLFSRFMIMDRHPLLIDECVIGIVAEKQLRRQFKGPKSNSQIRHMGAVSEQSLGLSRLC